jgi:hypothetical protein
MASERQLPVLFYERGHSTGLTTADAQDHEEDVGDKPRLRNVSEKQAGGLSITRL